MPFQTFAHGGATRLALERLMDDRAVVGQRANQRMLFQERQRFLLRRLTPEESPHGAEAPTTVRKGDCTGFFQGFAGVLLRQRQETLQHPRAFDAAGVHHRLGPLPRVRTDHAHFMQEVSSPAFQPAAVHCR